MVMTSLLLGIMPPQPESVTCDSPDSERVHSLPAGPRPPAGGQLNPAGASVGGGNLAEADGGPEVPAHIPVLRLGVEVPVADRTEFARIGDELSAALRIEHMVLEMLEVVARFEFAAHRGQGLSVGGIS